VADDGDVDAGKTRRDQKFLDRIDLMEENGTL
jgi:hypothetical protein